MSGISHAIINVFDNSGSEIFSSDSLNRETSHEESSFEAPLSDESVRSNRVFNFMSSPSVASEKSLFLVLAPSKMELTVLNRVKARPPSSKLIRLPLVVLWLVCSSYGAMDVANINVSRSFDWFILSMEPGKSVCNNFGNSLSLSTSACLLE